MKRFPWMTYEMRVDRQIMLPKPEGLQALGEGSFALAARRSDGERVVLPLGPLRWARRSD